MQNDVYFISPDKKIVIIHNDFLKTNSIPENSIDLIVTSPPYNLGIDYNTHNDDMAYDEYLEFTYRWMSKAIKLVKPDGRMCLNIPMDTNVFGHYPLYADVIQVARRAGWKHYTTVIWNKGNISKRTAWGSWLSARAPCVIAPVEVIAVLYKKQWRKLRDGKSDITKQEFVEWTLGLWSFPGENRKKIGHPAPFPIELPKRCIKLFSYVGDTVLDPFLGSGTTLLACVMLDRRGIGVEIDEEYCKLSVKRVSSRVSLLSCIERTPATSRAQCTEPIK